MLAKKSASLYLLLKKVIKNKFKTKFILSKKIKIRGKSYFLVKRWFHVKRWLFHKKRGFRMKEGHFRIKGWFPRKRWFYLKCPYLLEFYFKKDLRHIFGNLLGTMLFKFLTYLLKIFWYLLKKILIIFIRFFFFYFPIGTVLVWFGCYFITHKLDSVELIQIIIDNIRTGIFMYKLHVELIPAYIKEIDSFFLYFLVFISIFTSTFRTLFIIRNMVKMVTTIFLGNGKFFKFMYKNTVKNSKLTHFKALKKRIWLLISSFYHSLIFLNFLLLILFNTRQQFPYRFSAPYRKIMAKSLTTFLNETYTEMYNWFFYLLFLFVIVFMIDDKDALDLINSSTSFKTLFECFNKITNQNEALTFKQSFQKRCRIVYLFLLYSISFNYTLDFIWFLIKTYLNF